MSEPRLEAFSTAFADLFENLQSAVPPGNLLKSPRIHLRVGDHCHDVVLVFDALLRKYGRFDPSEFGQGQKFGRLVEGCEAQQGTFSSMQSTSLKYEVCTVMRALVWDGYYVVFCSQLTFDLYPILSNRPFPMRL